MLAKAQITLLTTVILLLTTVCTFAQYQQVASGGNNLFAKGYGSNYFNSSYLNTQQKDGKTNDWELGISVNPGVTVGLGDFIIGGDASLNRHLTKNLEATFSAGYTYFSKTHSGTYVTVSPNGTYVFNQDTIKKYVVPVKLGLRYYLLNKFYIGGEAGVGFASNGTNSFVYSPSIGIRFKSGFDFGVKYENYSSRLIQDNLSLKLSYRLPL